MSEVTAIPSGPSPNEALVPFPLSKQPLVTALTDYSTHDLYLKAIEEMYTDFTTGWLRSNMAFHEDWATTLANPGKDCEGADRMAVTSLTRRGSWSCWEELRETISDSFECLQCLSWTEWFLCFDHLLLQQRERHLQ